MKKRIIVFILLFSSVLFLSSCKSDKVTPKDQIEAGYTCIVKFDANGGILNEEKIVTIYAKPDSYILAPGSKTVNATTLGQGPSFSEVPLRSDYKFQGWYRGSLNSLGEVEFEDQFNFEVDKVTESFTLYAKWDTNYQVNIHYGIKNDSFFNKSYSFEKIIDENTIIRTEMKKINDVEGYTFEGFYTDKELTKKLVYGEKQAYDADTKTLDIYSKYIEGDWTVVSNASELLRITKSMKIYITKDLDFTGFNASDFNWVSGFSGEIEGNGHKLSNINVNVVALGREKQRYAMWDALSSANISDLTIENSSYKIDYADFVNGSFAFLSGEIEGTTFKNVVFSNVDVEVLVTSVSNVLSVGILAPEEDGITGVTINSNCTTNIIINE